MKIIVRLVALIAALNAGTVVADEFSMPFGLAAIPGARLAISDAYDTAGGDREESIARFGTQVAREEVISFYRNALEEAGFKIYSSSDRPDYAMIAGKRDDDRITVYYKNQSDWVEADEGELSVKAEYNKQ
ncbi:MAG: hypothetical protein WBA20_08060 [Ketobacter sp.]